MVDAACAEADECFTTKSAKALSFNLFSEIIGSDEHQLFFEQRGKKDVGPIRILRYDSEIDGMILHLLNDIVLKPVFQLQSNLWIFFNKIPDQERRARQKKRFLHADADGSLRLIQFIHRFFQGAA